MKTWFTTTSMPPGSLCFHKDQLIFAFMNLFIHDASFYKISWLHYISHPYLKGNRCNCYYLLIFLFYISCIHGIWILYASSLYHLSLIIISLICCTDILLEDLPLQHHLIWNLQLLIPRRKCGQDFPLKDPNTLHHIHRVTLNGRTIAL